MRHIIISAEEEFPDFVNASPKFKLVP